MRVPQCMCDGRTVSRAPSPWPPPWICGANGDPFRRAPRPTPRRPSPNEQRPHRMAGPLLSCIHRSWRWRELNPRPTLTREGFSGRSPLCPYSAPPVSRTGWCDRPSRCLLSLKIPRPDPSVIPLAGARIRVGRTPGLTDSLLAQAARAKSVRLEFALDFLQRMVNEIIVAFLGPLHLT